MGKPLIDKSKEAFDADGNQIVFAITPFGHTETRAQRLQRWEAMGSYDPNCKQCEEMAASPRLDAFMPHHRASAGCRSGGRPHCSCSSCF